MRRARQLLVIAAASPLACRRRARPAATSPCPAAISRRRSRTRTHGTSRWSRRSPDRRRSRTREFLAFVTRDPQWRRDRAPAVRRIALSLALGGAARRSATARAGPARDACELVRRRGYCEARATAADLARMGNVAAADETRRDAREIRHGASGCSAGTRRPSTARAGRGRRSARIFTACATCTASCGSGSTTAVALLVASDSRDQGDADKLSFCGAGSAGVDDRDNYAVLMRIALLSSLEGRATPPRISAFAAQGLMKALLASCAHACSPPAASAAFPPRRRLRRRAIRSICSLVQLVDVAARIARLADCAGRPIVDDVLHVLRIRLPAARGRSQGHRTKFPPSCSVTSASSSQHRSGTRHGDRTRKVFAKNVSSS